jgi:hypothetical protein
MTSASGTPTPKKLPGSGLRFEDHQSMNSSATPTQSQGSLLALFGPNKNHFADDRSWIGFADRNSPSAGDVVCQLSGLILQCCRQNPHLFASITIPVRTNPYSS